MGINNSLQTFLRLPKIERKKESKETLFLDNDESSSNKKDIREISFKTNINTAWYFITSENINAQKIVNTFTGKIKTEIYNQFYLRLEQCPQQSKILVEKVVLGDSGNNIEHVITFSNFNNKETEDFIIFRTFNDSFTFILFDKQNDVAIKVIRFDHDCYASFVDLKDRISIADNVFITIFNEYYLSSDTLIKKDDLLWELLGSFYEKLNFSKQLGV